MPPAPRGTDLLALGTWRRCMGFGESFEAEGRGPVHRRADASGAALLAPAPKLQKPHRVLATSVVCPTTMLHFPLSHCRTTVRCAWFSATMNLLWREPRLRIYKTTSTSMELDRRDGDGALLDSHTLLEFFFFFFLSLDFKVGEVKASHKDAEISLPK